ncbi:MAG: DnaJ domain-containing protein [Nitrospirae bacterium]|nr:DnaJ domain-containing protein [Nitrospirota bacterium]
MPNPVPFSGKLEENTLPRLLNHLHELKSTGTVSVSRDSIVKKLFVKGGAIIFASSTYEGDRLGELLLKAGKINMKQFDNASKIVIETGKRLGGVLVELGYISPKDLFWGVKYQVQEIVCGLFDWTDGSYEFSPGELPAAEVITLHISTANLILQGIKRVDDWTRISRGIPPMDGVLKVTSNPLKLYQEIDMSEEEKRIVALFDGKRTIKGVFEKAELGGFEALKAVYVLYTIGMLEEAQAGEKGKASAGEAAAATQMAGDVKPLDKTSLHKAYIDSKSQNYYELLKVDTEASSAELEDAYNRLARVYHPDHQFKEGMEGLKGELEELFNKITEAHSILSDDSRRWEYDLTLATAVGDTGKKAGKPRKAKDLPKAREAFDKGIESFKAKDFESATVHFKEAARLDPTNAAHFSYLALALLQRPKREAEAEEAMLEAIAIEPNNAEHQANLGLLYQRTGISDKAKEAFSEALRLDPKNAKAKKGLGKK